MSETKAFSCSSILEVKLSDVFEALAEHLPGKEAHLALYIIKAISHFSIDAELVFDYLKEHSLEEFEEKFRALIK